EDTSGLGPGCPFPKPAALTEDPWYSVEGISFCMEIAVSRYGEPMWCFPFARPLLNFCPLTSHWNLLLGTPLKNGQQEIRITVFSPHVPPPLGGPSLGHLRFFKTSHLYMPFLPSSISTSLILLLGSEQL
ncbi:mCG145086, partial [Mus musculus]